MAAYYNEIDPYAAQWLRNLISAGHIAPGDVDERSIEDVAPIDLIGYTQCHFFAGIGIWSHALRIAGISDETPVWTGSCPCQPFSSAGQGRGFADERHLWPAFSHLIEQCQPAIVVGEQVAGKDGGIWIDLVQADMEAMDYAFGAVPFPSCSVGGPHRRERTYWLGYSKRARLEGFARYDSTTEWPRPSRSTAKAGCLGSVADAHGEQARVSRFARQSRATRGYWASADWIPCRDGYWRPVQPGTFPLAHGVPNRMGKLRGYGNAIVPQEAQAFIEAVMDCCNMEGRAAA